VFEYGELIVGISSRATGKRNEVTGTVSGLILVTVAGVANATFALPMKFARRWAWENIWLAWTLFALVLLPVATAIVSIPSLGAVYRDAGASAIAVVMLCGAGWGLAQVLFGLSIDAIGIGLTFSIVLGVSAAVGSLIPLLRLQHASGRFSMMGPIIPGIVLVVAGVFVCAVAGRMREKAQDGGEKKRKSFGVGLAMALCSGVCAASMNFGVAFGEPLLRSAVAHGAAPQQVVNAVWLPLLLAGAIPNIAYCVYLLMRQRSGVNFRSKETPVYLALAMVMAILWFFSTALYGVATTQLGELGAVIGWPVFMSLIVVTAGILGMFTGEWRHSGTRPMVLQVVGMLLLVVAVVALSRAQRQMAAISVLHNTPRSVLEIGIGRKEVAL
jgi:L-rhamnose-H+ transport protein